MIVAGGGAGSTGSGQPPSYGGGGGAGGFRETKSPVTQGCYTASPLDGQPSAPNRVTVTVTSYPIVVGGGGTTQTYQPTCTPGPTSAMDGSVSSGFGISAAGGGGGGQGNNSSPHAGRAGGSGGGSGGRSPPNGGGPGAGNTPPTTPPQGNNGGCCWNLSWCYIRMLVVAEVLSAAGNNWNISRYCWSWWSWSGFINNRFTSYKSRWWWRRW